MLVAKVSLPFTVDVPGDAAAHDYTVTGLWANATESAASPSAS